MPDGIAADYVYEFKAVGDKFLLFWEKPCALVQADLYGTFFEREKKKVQILIEDNAEIQTFFEGVNRDNASKVLEKFRAADKGEANPAPPKKWKCKACEFKEQCSMKK